MKKLIHIATAIVAAATALVACDDTTSTVGSSLVEDNVEVVMDSSFTLEGVSVLNSRVQSRTITQLLGSLDAEGYGRLTSNVVTQFMPGVALETDSFTVNDIDSVKLIMHIVNGCFTGDSLRPMGVTVYPLTRALPSPIYSDFDPTDYYDAAHPWGSTIYAANALGCSDSVQNLTSRRIEVMLPRSFAVDIYNQYKNSPETFQTPQSFAQWFPGLYLANSFGSGRVTRIDKSYITMFYHRQEVSESTGADTIINYTNTYLSVTPEIITNNIISYTRSPEITSRVAAGEALIVAPTGYDINITFPGKELVDYCYANMGPISLLNGLSMEIPVDEIVNDYGIDPPAYLLMVKTSQLDEFFAKNKINDGVNSFYAAYDATSKSYYFSDMRNYLQDLLERGDEITPDDVEFTLTPITVTTETQNYTTVVTGIVPYVTNPVMARLRLDKANIKLTFTKQTL